MAYFAKYRLDDFDDQVDFIKKQQFGCLISQHEQGMLSTSLPFFVEEGSVSADQKTLTLVAHMSTINPQYKTPLAREEVLLVFTGPNTYIAPVWSPSKKVDHKVVPTWNYGTVQAYGIISYDTEKDHKRQAVSALTNANEKDRAEPWKVSDAPAAYTNILLDAIVVVRVRVTRMLGIHKYSQDKPESDRQGIVEGLQEEGSQCPRAKAVAEVMRPSSQMEKPPQRTTSLNLVVMLSVCVCLIAWFSFLSLPKRAA
ncbi:transcriptional regulator [Strigomonas culicis]|uniref:Transcriptional regulator n=1 Tax=Strigomonas culicis TaxID=28005 RepID=S9UQL7_9TRYP|nr:transcriptional regulator [Strigomonas culicis]|eukprot:EPY16941.1 transcriptional regulator [Strigomonas culicis]